ncbi:MAG TPA: aminodeoxychorismate synthase, component I, partial [Rhodanobacteraceae bacterium]|nr:aminodeoxychorismate synthase, component I [Rhodanobacteraceae bacterium]
MSHVRELQGIRDLLPLAAAFPRRYPALLESVARGSARTRYDILFAFPDDEIRLDRDGVVRDANGVDVGASFLSALDAAWSDARIPRADDQRLPFRGGWLVYLGYELAGEIEPKLRLPRAPGEAQPVALALRCPAAIILDHVRESTWLVTEADRPELLDTLAADACAARAAVAPLRARAAIDEDAPARFIDGV